MRRLAAPAVLLILLLLAYQNCFDAPFVFDDQRLILENPHIRSLTPFWAPLAGTSRPLVQWSLALNYALSGHDVWSYHLLNLLIHFAASCTVFAIVRRCSLKFPQTQARATLFAFVTAALWSLHPLQTESVTYVIQRAESLSGLFCLLALYLAMRGMQVVADRRKTAFFLFVSACSSVLAMSAKPTAVVAPFLVLLYDVTFQTGSMRAALRSRCYYYGGLFATLLTLPLVLTRNMAEWNTTAGLGSATISPLSYMLSQPHAILRYVTLAVWPTGLCLDYGSPPTRSWPLFCVLAGALMCSAAALWRNPKNPAVFLVCCFFLLLAPTSSVVPVADLVVEHRIYLALAPLLILAVLVVNFGLGAFGRWRDLIAATFTGVAVLLLCGLTLLRNEDYRSEITLWRRAIQVNPQNPRAHYNLGTALLRTDQLEMAASELHCAIGLRPTPEAFYNLGNAYLRQNAISDAIHCYKKTLLLEPADWQAHNNLGVALMKAGSAPEAALEFQTALRLNPDCVSAQTNLLKISARANSPNGSLPSG